MTDNPFYKQYNSSSEGLSPKEALTRLGKYGTNSLGFSNKPLLLKNIADQFTDFLVILLLIAAFLSILLGDRRTAIVMFSIVALNAIIGFAQQYRTERTLIALKKLLPHHSTVIRDNQEKEILSEYLVPGDLIILQAGDLIPADGVVIQQFSFKVNESSLTGESKVQAKSDLEDTNHLRANKVFAGTTVLEGEARVIVNMTGTKTEFGQIAQKTKQTTEELSPLQKKLRQVGRTVAMIAGSIMLALIFYSIFREKVLLHHDLAFSAFRDIFIFALAVAAALVPEGLPATVSVALSFGANRLIKKKAIVRKLAAVETLGSTNVICTDKTGTLTIGKMSLVNILTPDQGRIVDITKFDLKKSEMLMLNFALCQNVQKNDRGLVGDADEVAFWEASERQKIDPIEYMNMYKKVREFSFNPIRKMMSVVIDHHGEKIILSKGNPNIILNKCKVDLPKKQFFLQKVDEMASEGLRVFAFAHRILKQGDLHDMDDMEDELIFDGLAGLSDDIHPEVPAAIKYCQKAGIRIVMITGDYKITADAIAKKINLFSGSENHRMVSGDELAKMSDLELRDNLLHPIVFYQTDPVEKLRIVSTLQNMGLVVAVTGDGVNDALALKKADIGIAMGKAGTDVAKEAADMILLDDNFATIVSAIQEGRVIWNNLKKFVFYVFSSNAGEFMTVFCGILFGIPAPLIAVQILSIDLGTDVLPSLALAADNQTKDVLNEDIRKRDSLLSSKMLIRLLWVGTIMGGGAAFSFWLINGFGMIGTDRYFQATTAAWVTLVICQIVNVFEVRGGLTNFKDSFFGNKFIIWSVLGEIALMFSVVYWPTFQNILSTRSLSAAQWLVPVSVGLLFILTEEFIRRYYQKRSLILEMAE